MDAYNNPDGFNFTPTDPFQLFPQPASAVTGQNAVPQGDRTQGGSGFSPTLEQRQRALQDSGRKLPQGDDRDALSFLCAEVQHLLLQVNTYVQNRARTDDESVKASLNAMLSIDGRLERLSEQSKTLSEKANSLQTLTSSMARSHTPFRGPASVRASGNQALASSDETLEKQVLDCSSILHKYRAP